MIILRKCRRCKHHMPIDCFKANGRYDSPYCSGCREKADEWKVIRRSDRKVLWIVKAPSKGVAEAAVAKAMHMQFTNLMALRSY